MIFRYYDVIKIYIIIFLWWGSRHLSMYIQLEDFLSPSIIRQKKWKWLPELLKSN